ncbi:cysteine-rich CWC family protein [Paenibacillus sp. strain BS8-2]
MCPLCGQNNDCAMERSADAQDCWCTGVSIPPELLAAIPRSLIGINCICHACVTRFHEHGSWEQKSTR